MSARGRASAWLFVGTWLAFAGFHQGGGWSQNARFALVRAIVEQGRFAIDDYAVYVADPRRERPRGLVRMPVERGAVRGREGEVLLTWIGSGEPLREAPARARRVRLDQVAVTGDLSYARGHLHPNKAPGASLLAVPGYFVLYRLERAFGIDPDDWWVLTVNAWLTSALSVGLAAAAGCVLFLHVAQRLSGAPLRVALVAALAFAFGTPYFPNATLLMDVDVAAAALLAALFFGLRAAEDARPRALVACGLAAGWAGISSYSALLAAPLFAAWLTVRMGRWALPGYGLGLALPFALAGFYHWACFGTPFATGYQFEDPLFRQRGALLGVLSWPGLERIVGVLVSPYRGLFFGAPVLAMGLWGGWQLAQGCRRADAALLASLFAGFLLFNVCFTTWHGGWGVGPRYLVPAVPFLALPLAVALRRVPRTTLALAALSAFAMTAFVAVDPQTPVGSDPIAERPGRPRLLREPLTEYALPIFLFGRATPILAAQEGPGRRPVLSHFVGPVSANPIGVYEAWLGRAFPLRGPQARWNSFNAGELLLPQRRASLGLVALLAGAPLAMALRAAGRPATSPLHTAVR